MQKVKEWLKSKLPEIGWVKWLIFDIIIAIVITVLLGTAIDLSNFDAWSAQNDEAKIIGALNTTDPNIVRLITEVDVIENKSLLETKCEANDLVGCVDMVWDNNDKITSAAIYVLPSQSYQLSFCNTFNNTFFHELGHIDFAMKYGMENNTTIKEAYADAYAENKSKKKC